MSTPVTLEDFSEQMRNLVDNEAKEAEEQEHLSIMQVNAATVMESDLRVAYMRLQTKYVQLRTEYKALDHELYLLRLAMSNGSISTTEAALNDLIKAISRKYAILIRIWVPKLLFPAVAKPIDPADPQRWANEDMQLRGHITELLMFLDEKLRLAATQYPLFAEHASVPVLFGAGVEAERGNCVSTVKENIGGILSEFIELDHNTCKDSSLLMAHPGVIALRKNPTEPKVDYPKYPSVLYQDPNFPCKQGLFRSSALIKAAKCILFGPTSLGVRGGTGGHTAKGDLWSLEYPTPGLIACVAVLVSHRVGEDDSFKLKKNRSGVFWPARFDFYYMAMCSSDTKDWWDPLFKFWAKELFGIENGALAAASGGTLLSVTAVSAVDDVFEELKRPASPGFGNDLPPLPPVSTSDSPLPPHSSSEFALPSVSSGIPPSISRSNGGAAVPAVALEAESASGVLHRHLGLLSISSPSSTNLSTSSESSSVASLVTGTPVTTPTVPVVTAPVQNPRALRRGQAVVFERSASVGTTPTPSVISVVAPPPAPAPPAARTTRARTAKAPSPSATESADASGAISANAGRARRAVTKGQAIAGGK
ncbi:hypothetical protein CONPUDRAFT_155404 [Coniophora puteana RWD-64-598 SS2]|uniref:Uncharacterized protein n=1 Tax=Coniophora puteana (strain RWD-64-598) TaxID=741705 RepID=A0A5M3MLI7_CONPW|nr:uncharacterized protein CONPUDRAFT_155404 [Coniophora puteana RWD-64-598 SS2]EIW80028.1 hypothetical protein CONPUDRAFT_155404 [Coniophora puteana RWD-64-598 SS2]